MKTSHGTARSSAGRIRAALVIAGDDDLFAPVLQHDLRGAEHVAGGHEADVDVADANGFRHRRSAARPAAHSDTP